MKKLKLEELEVTSFATTSDAASRRGTVVGAAAVPPAQSRGCPVIETYDVQACGDTQYFDCTYGCSWNTNCANGCVVRITDGPECVETA